MNYKTMPGFFENSENTTHPVAELSPLVVDGLKFFDIYGNVREWLGDYWWQSDMNHRQYSGGVDPKGPKHGDQRVWRGGSAFDRSWAAHLAARFAGTPKAVDHKHGFRLVRERP